MPKPNQNAQNQNVPDQNQQEIQAPQEQMNINQEAENLAKEEEQLEDVPQVQEAQPAQEAPQPTFEEQKAAFVDQLADIYVKHQYALDKKAFQDVPENNGREYHTMENYSRTLKPQILSNQNYKAFTDKIKDQDTLDYMKGLATENEGKELFDALVTGQFPQIEIRRMAHSSQTLHRDPPKFGEAGYLNDFLDNAKQNGWDAAPQGKDRGFLTEMYKAATDPEHPHAGLSDALKNVEKTPLDKNYPSADKQAHTLAMQSAVDQVPLTAENAASQALRNALYGYSNDAMREQQRMRQQMEEELANERKALLQQQKQMQEYFTMMQEQMQTYYSQMQQMQRMQRNPSQNSLEEDEPEAAPKKRDAMKTDPAEGLDKASVDSRNKALAGAISEQGDYLMAKHRVTGKGGSSSEHTEMMESLSNLMEKTQKKPYNAMEKADALMEARKKTQNYIKEKRGKQLGDKVKFRTKMGETRFNAANETLDALNKESKELGLDGIYAAVYDMQDELNAKHWHRGGGSTTEHSNLMKKVDLLKKACLVEDPLYSPERKAKALREAKKAALEYIKKKRGNHPEGWQPKTGMGKKRLAAAEKLVEEINKEMRELGIEDEMENELTNEKENLTPNKKSTLKQKNNVMNEPNWKALAQFYKKQYEQQLVNATKPYRGNVFRGNQFREQWEREQERQQPEMQNQQMQNQRFQSNPNIQQQRQNQRVQPDPNDPASIKPYQDGIRNLVNEMKGKSYDELQANSLEYGKQMLNLMIPLVAKKLVYNDAVLRNDPNYRNKPGYAEKEKQTKMALASGMNEKFNTMIRSLASPEFAIKLGTLASMGDAKNCMNMIASLPKSPLRRTVPQQNLNMNLNLSSSLHQGL